MHNDMWQIGIYFLTCIPSLEKCILIKISSVSSFIPLITRSLFCWNFNSCIKNNLKGVLLAFFFMCQFNKASVKWF